MAELRDILLEDIEDLHNYREVEPPSDKDADMVELAADIKVHGILQPVLCRPHANPMKEKAGKVQLIYGHRRKLAAKMNGMSAIPALIKFVPDEEILEIQVTENLHRKDVHPLDEAGAYKAYGDQKKLLPEEIALKFGKAPQYVAQRLSFNNLIPELRKDFKAGILLIGHAVLLARLQPADQKLIMGKAKNHHHKQGDWYDSVDDMKEDIECDIMHELTHAAFDKKDASLVKKAGACTTCQKRSGAGLLFPDIKEKDRCFDGACYRLKVTTHLLRQIDELVIGPNPMPVIVGYSSSNIDPAVKKKLTENKIKLLEEMTDYSQSTKKTTGATLALKVCGSDAGRVVGIILKKTDKARAAKAAAKDASVEDTAEMIDSQINGIKERAKRSIELDAEKIHKRIVEHCADLKPFKEPNYIFLTNPFEMAALYFIAYKKMDSDDQKQLAKLLGLPTPKNFMNFYGGNETLLFDKLVEAPAEALAFIIRAMVRSQMMGTGILPTHTEGHIVRKIAEQYPAIPIAQYQVEQKAIADKRIAREKERIDELQEKKKALKPAAAKKSSSPKKKKASRNGGDESNDADVVEPDFNFNGNDDE